MNGNGIEFVPILEAIEADWVVRNASAYSDHTQRHFVFYMLIVHIAKYADRHVSANGANPCAICV